MLSMARASGPCPGRHRRRSASAGRRRPGEWRLGSGSLLAQALAGLRALISRSSTRVAVRVSATRLPSSIRTSRSSVPNGRRPGPCFQVKDPASAPWTRSGGHQPARRVAAVGFHRMESGPADGAAAADRSALLQRASTTRLSRPVLAGDRLLMRPGHRARRAETRPVGTTEKHEGPLGFEQPQERLERAMRVLMAAAVLVGL